MTRNLYSRYMKLCKTWGSDPRKVGRDLGAQIRERVVSEFRQGDLTVIKDPDECQAKLESLERIASNTYYQESDARMITSTGLTRLELEAWTSTEVLEGTKQLSEGSKVDRVKIALDYYKNRFLKKNENVIAVHPENDIKKNGNVIAVHPENGTRKNDTKKLPNTESRSKSEDTK